MILRVTPLPSSPMSALAALAGLLRADPVRCWPPTSSVATFGTPNRRGNTINRLIEAKYLGDVMSPLNHRGRCGLSAAGAAAAQPKWLGDSRGQPGFKLPLKQLVSMRKARRRSLLQCTVRVRLTHPVGRADPPPDHRIANSSSALGLRSRLRGIHKIMGALIQGYLKTATTQRSTCRSSAVLRGRIDGDGTVQTGPVRAGDGDPSLSAALDAIGRIASSNGPKCGLGATLGFETSL